MFLKKTAPSTQVLQTPKKSVRKHDKYLHYTLLAVRQSFVHELVYTGLQHMLQKLSTVGLLRIQYLLQYISPVKLDENEFFGFKSVGRSILIYSAG